jgi:hypothetical protein
VKFYEDAFAVCVDKGVSVNAKTLHHAIGARNS